MFKNKWGWADNLSKVGLVHRERDVPSKLCSFKSAIVRLCHETGTSGITEVKKQIFMEISESLHFSISVIHSFKIISQAKHIIGLVMVHQPLV